MRAFPNKLIVTTITQENKWGYEDKDAAKLGKLAFPWKGKIEDEQVSLKKGDEVFYQYGNNVKIEGEEFTLVSPSNLICQK